MKGKILYLLDFIYAMPIISFFASHNDHLYSYKSIRDIDYCGGSVICAFNCERVLEL